MTVYYLGIDVSKGYADFVIIDRNKEVIEPNFRLDDTFAGHAGLYDVLAKFFEQHPDSELLAGLESTGGYENNWLGSLRRYQAGLKLQVARLNPAGVHAYSQANLKRIKTDALSARNVAEYLMCHPEKVNYQKQDDLADLRKQWTLHRMLVKQQTQLYNQLEKLMYEACPELLAYCKDGVPKWVLRLLEKYPTSAQLARAKVKGVDNIPYVSQTRAAELIVAAKQSVAVATGAVIAQVMTATVAQLLQLETQTDTLFQQMLANCPPEEIEIMTSFTGISQLTAIGLLLEFQSICRFADAKKFVAYFGLNPIWEESGDGLTQSRMSKKGRKEPRRILFMAALSAIRFNPLIKEIYERHVQNGMSKLAAIGVCMNKIARILYGMLKHKKPFDPEIDRANQVKHVLTGSSANAKIPVEDKNRRFQAPDKTAPVSGRQAKKRALQMAAVPVKSESPKSDATAPVVKEAQPALTVTTSATVEKPVAMANHPAKKQMRITPVSPKTPAQPTASNPSGQDKQSTKNAPVEENEKTKTMAFIHQLLA